MRDFLEWDAHRLLDAMANNRLSTAQVMAATLDQIEAMAAVSAVPPEPQVPI